MAVQDERKHVTDRILVLSSVEKNKKSLKVRAVGVTD